jgi:hypothetical protein
MEMKEYVVLSERTMAGGFYLDKEEIDLLHGAIGIATEMEEFVSCYGGLTKKQNFDLVNASEELADMAWYLAIFARKLNIDLSVPVNDGLYLTHSNEFSVFTEEMTVLSGQLLDIFKKKMFYNRAYNTEKISDIIIKMHSHIWCLSTYCLKVPFGIALQNNIDKLRKRFPDKFETNLANNRDLNAERMELEKGI